MDAVAVAPATQPASASGGGARSVPTSSTAAAPGPADAAAGGVELGRHGTGAGNRLTAYQAFFRVTFNDLRAAAVADWSADPANAGSGGKCKIPTNVIVRTIGEKWRALSPEEVEAFAERTGSIAPGRKHRRGVKRKRRVGASARNTGPKKPMTAYQLFFREHEGQLSGKTEGYTRAEGMSQNIIVRTIGERWRASQLTAEGNEAWKQKQAADKERYAKELVVHEATAAAAVAAAPPAATVDHAAATQDVGSAASSGRAADGGAAAAQRRPPPDDADNGGASQAGAEKAARAPARAPAPLPETGEDPGLKKAPGVSQLPSTAASQPVSKPHPKAVDGTCVWCLCKRCRCPQ